RAFFGPSVLLLPVFSCYACIFSSHAGGEGHYETIVRQGRVIICKMAGEKLSGVRGTSEASQVSNTSPEAPGKVAALPGPLIRLSTYLWREALSVHRHAVKSLL